jgi:hypothetical protein
MTLLMNIFLLILQQRFAQYYKPDDPTMIRQAIDPAQW